MLSLCHLFSDLFLEQFNFNVLSAIYVDCTLDNFGSSVYTWSWLVLRMFCPSLSEEITFRRSRLFTGPEQLCSPGLG